MFGSYQDTGLDYTHCFDRLTRYSPYGFEEDSGNRGGGKAKREETPDWKKVNWGQLQNECLLKNVDRYERVGMPNHTTLWLPTKEDTGAVDDTLYFGAEPRKSRWWSSGASFKKRSAAVIQMEPSTEWTVDTSEYIRSIITELSLHSGAEYEVIILVEVKDASRSIFADPAEYQKTFKKSVPEEFQGNSLLFNRVLVEGWYPHVPKHK